MYLVSSHIDILHIGISGFTRCVLCVLIMCCMWLLTLLLVCCLLSLCLGNSHEAFGSADVDVAIGSKVYETAIGLALTTLNSNAFGVVDCTEFDTVRCAVAFLVSPSGSNFVVPCLVIVVSDDLWNEECCSFEDVHCS